MEQAAKHCRNAYPNKTIDIEMSKTHATGSADITVASIASITSGDRLAKFDPSRFKLLLVDEAHHIVAPGYLKTLKHFNLSTSMPKSPALVGVSATLSRFDGLKLGAALDHVVYHKDYISMIGEKWLSDVIFTTVRSTADISRVRQDPNGDFKSSELSRIVNTDVVNEITFRSWLSKAGSRKSTIIFCCDIAHVEGLAKTYRKHGIDARYILGTTRKKERSDCLDAFRARQFPVLINCAVFTEGTDVPNIDCVVLARPTRSRNLLVQMIGRGMRLYPGKENCHVIDMVASLETGIVTTPTLFGLDPSELVSEANVHDMKARLDEKEKDAVPLNGPGKQKVFEKVVEAPKKVTFTDYDSIFDLVGDTRGEQHIRSISQHAWVCVAPDKYILADSDGSFLRIARSDGHSASASFIVTETMNLNGLEKAKYARPRKLLEAESFQDAVHGADTYASKKYTRSRISVRQAWRSHDASEGQLAVLSRFRLKKDKEFSGHLTKGAAADMIIKFIHGARGRFNDMQADRKRGQRSQLRNEKLGLLAERESVSVGPILS